MLENFYTIFEKLKLKYPHADVYKLWEIALVVQRNEIERDKVHALNRIAYKK